jgi:hypothetical protein
MRANRGMMSIRDLINDVRLVYFILLINILLILVFEADFLGVAETFAWLKVPLILIACILSIFNLLYLIIRPV